MNKVLDSPMAQILRHTFPGNWNLTILYGVHVQLFTHGGSRFMMQRFFEYHAIRFKKVSASCTRNYRDALDSVHTRMIANRISEYSSHLSSIATSENIAESKLRLNCFENNGLVL